MGAVIGADLCKAVRLVPGARIHSQAVPDVGPVPLLTNP